MFGVLAVGLFWLIGRHFDHLCDGFCSFHFGDCWLCVYFRDKPARGDKLK
jgi:hypothetical protein